MNRTLYIRTTGTDSSGPICNFVELAVATTDKLAPQFNQLVATITAMRGEPDSILPPQSSGCHASWNARDDQESSLTIVIDQGE